MPLSKKDRIVYRATTGIVGAVMVYSILNFTLFDRFPFPEGGFVHLGLPAWFKVELTTAKILGVGALLIPGIPAKIKQFAYFGFGLTLISAAIAHLATGDARISPLFVLDPLVFLALLGVSYSRFLKLNGESIGADAGVRSGRGAGRGVAGVLAKGLRGDHAA
jgi:DoxX-like family